MFKDEPTEQDKMIAKGIADGISNALFEIQRGLLYLAGIILLIAAPFSLGNGPYWIALFGTLCILFAYLINKL